MKGDIKLLDLFIDEYPPDLYSKGHVFCIAVVDVSQPLAGFKECLAKVFLSLFPFQTLRFLKIRAYLGYIDVRKEPKLLNYPDPRNKKYFEAKGINGSNMLWSTVAIYCVVGFIMRFYKYNQPPLINLFHDPKSMKEDHRFYTYDFLKSEIPKWFKAFTDGKVQPFMAQIEEGKKIR